MEQPLPHRAAPLRAPTFYLTGRHRLSPGAVLLAIVAAAGGLAMIVHALGDIGHARSSDKPGAYRTAGTPSEAHRAEDDKDDPNQVDTIVLGDAADAPVPARRGGRVSDVHATILIRLPRYGEQVGLIPDTPSGHLLYRWLAAFNEASYPALAEVLPNQASALTAAAQMELRQQTGGFNLLSAKEVQPGVLVFRLRDQSPDSIEVLGTLAMLPGSNPATIASFSLRSIPQVRQNSPNPASAGTSSSR